MNYKTIKSKLTKADVKELCDAAEAASRAKPRSKNVTFSWRGGHYKIRLTNLCLYVDASDGTPMVSRYH